MGRFSYSNRYTDNDSLELSLPDLKKHGKLVNGYNGSITWSNGFGEMGAVNLSVDLNGRAIQFEYVVFDEVQRYLVYLVAIPCHFGGFRWLFACPTCGSSKKCLRRSYTLYKPPNSPYFGCRHCMSLTYRSQRHCRLKYENSLKMIGLLAKINEIDESIKKMHYGGRITRKQIRLGRLRKKLSSLV
jgi:hypothetical protein